MSDSMRQVELLRAACCVAGVDGHTSDSERRALERFASEIGVGSASLNAMIDCAESDKDFYSDQFRVVKAEPKKTMQQLFQIAILDGKLRTDEALVLKRLSRRLAVPDAQFDSWLKQTVEYVRKKAADRTK